MCSPVYKLPDLFENHDSATFCRNVLRPFAPGTSTHPSIPIARILRS